MNCGACYQLQKNVTILLTFSYSLTVSIGLLNFGWFIAFALIDYMQNLET